MSRCSRLSGWRSGRLTRAARSRILSGWQREASRGRVVLRAKGPNEYAAHMAIAGIGIKRVGTDG
jgi:hypothetical protein